MIISRSQLNAKLNLGGFLDCSHWTPSISSCNIALTLSLGGEIFRMDVRRQSNDNGMAEIPGVPRREVAGSSTGKLSKILALLLVVVSVVILAWFAQKAWSGLTADSAVKGKQYQAVFLTNGQVYFGKVSRVDSSYVKVTDIYYLQVQQTVQPKDNTAANAANQQVSLAKLGGELHGPEDVMYVSRQQVLFWENLKTDGKVAKAISDYKASGQK